MPTDDERRRVARKLREYASWDGEEDCFVDCADWGERVLNLLYRDGEDHTEGEYYARLADLIEPGEPKVKCVAEVKVDGERLEQLVHDAAVELTGIDRDALLALADEMYGRLDEYDVGLHGGIYMANEMRKYARRIREALGVES